MDNLFEQMTNISKAHAYDIVSKRAQELDIENKQLKEIKYVLVEALQACAEALNLLAIKSGTQAEGAPLKNDAPDDYGVINALTAARAAIKKATL